MFKLNKLFLLIIFVAGSLVSIAQPWVNEFHYDNNGGDVGEGIEIAGTAGTDLSCYDIVLYNGSNGATYNTISLSGTIPDEGCGYGAIWFAISPLQNGAPDGFALVNTCTNTVIQFLSYEGTFTATGGPANTMTSTNTGATETGGTAIGTSIQLTGSGSSYSDFISTGGWVSGVASSENSLNTGQTITPCGSVTLTTDAVNGGPFILDCTTSANGDVNFTATGTFSGNTFSVELSDNTGSFSSPTVIGSFVSDASGSGNISITVPIGTTPGASYCMRVTSSAPSAIADTICGIIIINSCIANIDAVNGGPFTVNCNTPSTDAGTVDYSTGASFNAGNVFTVQISDATGNFSNPVDIGSIISSTGGSIVITIPSNLISGAGYLVRIISSNPATVSSPSSPLTIAQTGACVPPYLTSVIINSCQTGPCPEGDNEIIFGNTGDFSLLATSANLNIQYGSSPTSVTYTDVLVTNPATTALLNTEAGCPGTFVEGTGATIPPGASFMVVNTRICPGALIWSSLCGAGPIYVIYSDDASWGSSGNFLNSSPGIRYFDITTTTTDGSTNAFNYEWDASLLPLGSDGDFASFGPYSGVASGYGNNGCALDPVVLGTTLINFEGVENNNQVNLYWNVSEQTNNDYFYIDHSIDGKNWAYLDKVAGHRNSNSIQYYTMPHSRPARGINYYILYSVDYDGKTYQKSITAVNISAEEAYFNSLTETIYFTDKIDVAIYSMDGKMIGEYINVNQVKFDKKGVFILRNLKNGETQRIFAN